MTKGNMENTSGEPKVSTPEVHSIEVKTKRSKWVWWVLGIIILGAIGYGGWQVGRTQVKTDNQTLNSAEKNSSIYKISYKDINFQFSKAKDVIVAGTAATELYPFVNLQLYKQDETTGYTPLHIEISVKNPLEKPSPITKEDIEKQAQQDTDIYDIGEVTIDGGAGVRYSIGGACWGDTTEFVKNDYTVEIKTYCTTRQSDYDQILSTFKFTN